MTKPEAELEFHRDVEKAMLNAWKNDLSREDVCGNLLLLTARMASQSFSTQIWPVFNEWIRRQIKPPKAA